MANRKTNKQLLQKMVREMDDIYLAFVVSELTSKASAVLKQEQEVRDSMKDHMVHPDLWINYHKEVEKFLNQN